MGDIINLRNVRKARERAEKDAAAAHNRADKGRSKSDKAREEAEAEHRRHMLDQHRRDPDDDEPA